MRILLGILVIWLSLSHCHESYAASNKVSEVSGVVRSGNDLLIVGDEDAGAYYRLRLAERSSPRIPIKPTGVERVALVEGRVAIDLESIDVLADGRVVVLSERLHALIGNDGVIIDYDNPMSEFGNRGLEGLAVRRLEDGSSRLAVLWEGGYPEYKDVPRQLRAGVGRSALRPVVWIHDLPVGGSGIEIKDKKKVREKYNMRPTELMVPQPVGQEPDGQRFRAPDLVWYEWHHEGEKGWGFIVLLSSQNSPVERKVNKGLKSMVG